MAAIDEVRRQALELEQESGFDVDVAEEAGQIKIVIKQVALPLGAYALDATDVLFVADYQYPLSALDMFWTNPEVVRPDGTAPEGADQVEAHLGAQWRRFSWHRNGTWNPNRNGLLDHFALTEDRFSRDRPD